MEPKVDIRTFDEVQEALGDLMRKHFRPVSEGRDVSQMLTTEELLHMVNSHSPDLVPPPMFREAMLGLGYTEKLIGNQFRWLLAERD
jgi:hypothetical protein